MNFQGRNIQISSLIQLSPTSYVSEPRELDRIVSLLEFCWNKYPYAIWENLTSTNHGPVSLINHHNPLTGQQHNRYKVAQCFIPQYEAHKHNLNILTSESYLKSTCTYILHILDHSTHTPQPSSHFPTLISPYKTTAAHSLPLQPTLTILIPLPKSKLKSINRFPHLMYSLLTSSINCL